MFHEPQKYTSFNFGRIYRFIIVTLGYRKFIKFYINKTDFQTNLDLSIIPSGFPNIVF